MKPIIFNEASIRAILAGRKTQTRRVIKRGTVGWMMSGDQRLWPYTGKKPVNCPYGQGQLWVRETAQLFSIAGVDGNPANPETWTIRYRAGGLKSFPRQAKQSFRFDRWTPSIFMPRWACRLHLNIKEIRVERLNSISCADIIAEGVQLPESGSLRTAWEDLWDSINAKNGRETNPWVWVIEFEPESAV